MRKRSILVCALVAALIATVTAGPAEAAAPAAPTATALNTSTLGHLTGTITSPGAPYVRLSLHGWSYGTTDLTLVADSAPFDLSTWGYGGTQRSLYAMACTTPEHNGSDCSGWRAIPLPTIPDVAPTVTWSADTTIGPGQSPAVTVDSDSGGGVLVAAWSVDPDSDTTVLTENGTTDLRAQDGSGTMSVLRCPDEDTDPRYCSAFTTPITKTYVVKRYLGLSWTYPPAVSTVRPDATIHIDTRASGSYDVTWRLEHKYQEVAEPRATILDQPLDADGGLDLHIPGALLAADGYYVILGAIRVRDPEYGTYTENIYASGYPGFEIDRTPPLSGSADLGRSLIYPRIGHPDRPATTTIQVPGYLPDIDGFAIKSGGTVVRRLSAHGGGRAESVWNGRNDAGAVVAPGVYTVHATDRADNETGVLAQVTVSPLQRVLRTYRRTVTARASLLDAYVGRCSTLRKPSMRGWAGSLGFYSGTRCKTRTWKASAASTAHGIRLPASARDHSLTVTTYGGAAKGGGSRGVIRFLSTSDRWHGDQFASAKLGNHLANVNQPHAYIRKDRWFYWGFYTAAGRKYDVARFTVELRYYVEY